MGLKFKISPETRLILLCTEVNINQNIEEKVKSILPLIEDWNKVLLIADRNRVQQLLYYQLKRICPEKIPEKIMKSLDNFYHFNAQRNLHMFSKLIEVLDALNSHDIDVLPYKGPVLALSAYGNLSLREFDDLDLFVHKEDVTKIKKILISIGFKPIINLNKNEERKYIQTMRDYIFADEREDIIIEIHWRFPSIYFSLPENPKLFYWDHCRKINIQSREILISSPEDMLLILCIHNAEHRWRRISLLCDIKEFVNTNNINWPIIFNKSKKLGINRIVLINFYLVKELLDLSLPDQFKKEFKSDDNIEKMSIMIISKLFSKDIQSISLIEETYISYKLREKRFFGIKDVIKGVSSPGILEWKKSRLPVSLFPLYYILRPFLLLKRHFYKS